MKNLDESILVQLHKFANWSYKKLNASHWFWFYILATGGIILGVYNTYVEFAPQIRGETKITFEMITEIIICILTLLLICGAAIIKKHRIMDELGSYKKEFKILSWLLCFARTLFLAFILLAVVGYVDILVFNSYINLFKKDLFASDFAGMMIFLLFLYFVDICFNISKENLIYYKYED